MFGHAYTLRIDINTRICSIQYKCKLLGVSVRCNFLHYVIRQILIGVLINDLHMQEGLLLHFPMCIQHIVYNI